MRWDSNSQRPSLQASLPLYCLFAPISPKPNYLVVWSTWLLQCAANSLIGWRSWWQELRHGLKPLLPRRKMEVLRRCGTKARWLYKPTSMAMGLSLMKLKWASVLCMQEGDTTSDACRCQGACNSAYQQVYFRSCDHVRILFSRFVMKTDPSAIAHWAISAFYEHLWTQDPDRLRYLVLSLNMS